MHTNKHFLIVLFLAASLLSACQFAAPATGVTPTPMMVPVGVPTLAVTLTLPPPTSSPITPTAEASPKPSPPPPTTPGASTCKDSAVFVTDVTIPDRTVIAASQPFNKIWRLSNNGTCTWGPGYEFVSVGGMPMTTTNVIAVPNTAPGATADLSIAMTAPAVPGEYAGQWQLRNASGTFWGPKVTVLIVVPGGAPPASLAIQSFTANIQDIPTGKRLTFTWQATGGTTARIYSGAGSARFATAWPVQPNGGTFSVDVENDPQFPNPSMTLTVYDDKNNMVSTSTQVSWPCKYDYFFAPAPGASCPDAPVSASAAEQPFQFGRMMWLEKTSPTVGSRIFVLYNDGRLQEYPDLWAEGQPPSDPALAPPAGMFQPVRGFGKVWRENPAVKQQLGWATAAEQGFQTIWQTTKSDSLAIPAYLHTADNRIIELLGAGGIGNWKYRTLQ